MANIPRAKGGRKPRLDADETTAKDGQGSRLTSKLSRAAAAEREVEAA